MNALAWTGVAVGCAFIVIMSALRSGRAEDERHGRLEEQQEDADDYKQARGVLNLSRPSEEIIRDQR